MLLPIKYPKDYKKHKLIKEIIDYYYEKYPTFLIAEIPSRLIISDFINNYIILDLKKITTIHENQKIVDFLYELTDYKGICNYNCSETNKRCLLCGLSYVLDHPEKYKLIRKEDLKFEGE